MSIDSPCRLNDNNNVEFLTYIFRAHPRLSLGIFAIDPTVQWDQIFFRDAVGDVEGVEDTHRGDEGLELGTPEQLCF